MSPEARPRRVRLPAALLALLLLLPLASGGAALAHATIVFGELEPSPNPPAAGEPLALELTMVDPTQLPVEDAVVLVELTPAEGGAAVESQFRETEPGVYRAEVTLAEAGEYRALLRDRTFRQEEARQTVTLTVGGAPLEPIEFVFPPTATGGRSVTVWLAWLIGVPLLVGIVVTVAVLAGGRDEEDAAGA